jgi:hypothetical protein
MYDTLKNDVQAELDHIRESNLYKEERVILSDQKPGITVEYPELRVRAGLGAFYLRHPGDSQKIGTRHREILR